jgi:carbamoyl-phosphate synthase large subunit
LQSLAQPAPEQRIGRLVDLVINIPIEYDELGRPDGYHIRRRAVDAGIPLITDLQRAQAIIEALRHRKVEDLAILSWDEYAARRPVALKTTLSALRFASTSSA